MRCRRGFLGGLVALLAGACLAPSALGFVLLGSERPYRDPVLTYWVSPDLASHMRPVAGAINRARVGVTLVRTADRASAHIDVASTTALRCRGVVGVGGGGGYNRGRVRMARGCPPVNMRLTLAHELGHALGLGHEDRRCATMNSRSFRTPSGVRTNRCPVLNWLARPYLADDLAGLRRRFVNRRPAAALTVQVDPLTLAVYAFDRSTDRDGDILVRRVDWGDGTSQELRNAGRPAGDRGPLFTPSLWATPKFFAAAGTYTVTLTVTDTYGATATTAATVTIAG